MHVVNVTIVSKKTGAKFSNFYNAESEYSAVVPLKTWKKAWANYQAKPEKWVTITTLKDLDKKAPQVEEKEEEEMPF